MYHTLYTDMKGKIYIDHELTCIGRSGSSWVEPQEDELMEMMTGSGYVMMPGHLPVGFDNAANRPRQVSAKETAEPVALACLLPQGFTRTLLPAAVKPAEAGELPTLGYTAVADYKGKTMVAACQTDEHRKWDPTGYNTPELESIIDQRLDASKNRILRQLSRCCLDYACLTAQNIFYKRWEGGIPVSPTCNAACVGCISRSHMRIKSPQERLGFLPDVEEIFEVGAVHLTTAEEGIVSFGQGCEGEPALAAHRIAPAVRKMREHTDLGSINLNTNGGFTEGVQSIIDAGLDSMRVTILSAREEDYNRYHQPREYRIEDVARSIRYAADQGVYVSLNLLTMPGFTDTEEQAEQILQFAQRNGVSMIQFRNLNLDPDLFFETIVPRSEAIGIPALIEAVRDEKIKTASYSHPARRGSGLL